MKNNIETREKEKEMNLISRILIIIVLIPLFAIICGYAVFTTGNAPNTLNNNPEIYYLVLTVYISSVIFTWLGQISNVIRLINSKEGEKNEQ